MQNQKQVRAAVRVAPIAAVQSQKAVVHPALIQIRTNHVDITKKGDHIDEALTQAAHQALRHHHRPVIRNETNDIVRQNGNQQTTIEKHPFKCLILKQSSKML